MNSNFRINEYLKPCQIGCLFLLVFLIILPVAAAAQDSSLLESGIDAFMNNQPRDAAAIFETVIAQGNTNPDTFLYLAHSYEQLGLYDQGINTLQNGLGYARDKRHLFYYNMGNLYLQKEDPKSAIEQFSLAISSRGSFSNAYLNRGNSYLREWELINAKSDYEQFLQLDPEHNLAPRVQQMINAIQEELAAEEARKLEEQRLAELEEERARLEALEAEQKAAEEEARRQELLNDILGNLNEAGSEAKTLGAGTEEIEEDEEEFQRAD